LSQGPLNWAHIIRALPLYNTLTNGFLGAKVGFLRSTQSWTAQGLNR
jgi:hypothetical protein